MTNHIYQMFMGRISVGAICALSLGLSSCGKDGALGFGGAGSKPKNSEAPISQSDVQVSASDPFESIAGMKNIDSPISLIESLESKNSDTNKTVFDTVAERPIDQFIDEVLSMATNDPFVFGDYHFQNAQDYLLRYESELMALASEHATLGDYLQSMGISSPADIEIAQLENALLTSQNLMEAGGIEDLLQSRSGDGDTSLFEGFSLQAQTAQQPPASGAQGGGGGQGPGNAAVDCAVYGTGTVAGAVATGIGCFIAAPVCLVGGLFTLASGIGTLESCGEAAAANGQQGGGQPQ